MKTPHEWIEEAMDFVPSTVRELPEFQAGWSRLIAAIQEDARKEFITPNVPRETSEET